MPKQSFDEFSVTSLSVPALIESQSIQLCLCENYGIQSGLAEVFFLSTVQPMIGSRHGSALAFSEALHPHPIAFLYLHLLGLDASQHFCLLALHLHAHFLLVGKMLSLEQADLAAPVLTGLAPLHLVGCNHLSLLLESSVLGLQTSDVAHQVSDADFDLAVASPDVFELTDKVAVASDLNWRQSERVDLLSNSGIDGLSLTAQRFQLKHEFLSIVQQIFLLQGQQSYLPDLFLILKDQLQQDVALLSQLAGLIHAFGLPVIRAHESAEQLFRIDGSFLI